MGDNGGVIGVEGELVEVAKLEGGLGEGRVSNGVAVSGGGEAEFEEGEGGMVVGLAEVDAEEVIEAGVGGDGGGEKGRNIGGAEVKGSYLGGEGELDLGGSK